MRAFRQDPDHSARSQSLAGRAQRAGLIQRAMRALRRDGFLGFFRLIAKNIAHWVKPTAHSSAPDPFDADYGTDTADIREIGTLDIRSPNALHAVRYQASPEGLVRDAIDSLGVDLRDFTFIDFGSGKGKVILIASTYPFRSVIGIEFATELHEVATANIARFPSHMKRAPVSSICCDASSFALPTSDLICYFWNPFGPSVLQPVAQSLCDHASRGHRVLVIYVHPLHANEFARMKCFEMLRGDSDLHIYFAH
jgi:hypothetical protein